MSKREREMKWDDSENGIFHLRIEQEAAGSRHRRRRGGARDRHGNRLVNEAVALPFRFLTAATHYRPLGATWPTPLVVGLCWSQRKT